MSPSNNSALLANLIVPPVDQVIPVEEWDWDEIRRLEDRVRTRFQHYPRCEVCGSLMVLGQIRTHHTCRPPVPSTGKKQKLGGK